MPHRILLIDDDDKVLKLLERYLGEILGYEVHSVQDGQAAVDLAMAQPFDLCIVDVHMPGITGSETYTRLKGIRPEIEAIFFTADVEFEKHAGFPAVCAAQRTRTDQAAGRSLPPDESHHQHPGAAGGVGN